MERKLATVLFVDIVDSTRLVTGADPEVVRRRVNQFFERVSHCVNVHGGIVEKFAGDAVLAAFGVPQAHEDDAERATRAALAMRDEVSGLGLQARIGIEAGELVVEAGDSSFVTGEAVNLAARLQQAAQPGEILLGPTAYRLAGARLEVEDAGPLELKGLGDVSRAWRVLGALGDAPLGLSGLRAPLVGRETELELLQNTFQRTLRDRRAHLFTIYGEPGVGKSRLAREFVDGVEGASVLSGRCLPYGESITYWPLAEMIKAAAGISDDDPLEEAFEKLRQCCEDEAVADLLGLAAGLLEKLDGERSPQEIAWAAREVMETLADVQPLVLLFEDIHWAEEPLLDLIEHLADWVRAPLLIICLARPELLDVRAGWGGGRVRSTAIELEPLSAGESEQLVEALLAKVDGFPAGVPQELLGKTEGNPLFVEETIRMLVEAPDGDGAADRIPDTLQAIIAARIDRLPPREKMLLQRASVIGRVFWRGAVERLSPDLEDLDDVLDDLLLRDFLLRETRSSITGESAFRFKHVLIREVAYSGLAKLARAQHHRRFAEWLKERVGEELVEIRAYHLDRAAELLGELDGAPPPELAAEAAEALTAAGRRALAREAYKGARKLLVRAVELEPTLKRRYHAARAAWRLGEYAAVLVEMEIVRDQARDQDDRPLEALALIGLGEAVLRRDADPVRAQTLVDDALRILETETEPDIHFEALTLRANVAVWRGSLGDFTQYLEQAFAVAAATGRADLQTLAATSLAQAHLLRLELDEAERLASRALELAEQSGSIRAQASAQHALGAVRQTRGDLDGAEQAYEETRALVSEIGLYTWHVASLAKLGSVAIEKGDAKRAEKLLREAIRLASRDSRAHLPDLQAGLAQALATQGKTEEAERLVLEATANVGPQDPLAQMEVVFALAEVRAAQGRDEEAERLYVEALRQAEEVQYTVLELKPLERLARLLRVAGRGDEAAPYEERLAGLLPSSTARIA